MASQGGTAKVPSLPPPRPKSPPKYPDLYGRRRESAKVQMLEREIGFLEDELKFLESLPTASKSCKEVADFVNVTSDPLVSTTKRVHKSCCFWKWLCGSPCFSFSWMCCRKCIPRTNIQCCCDCNWGDCLSCPSCTCTCTCSGCSRPKCHCCSCLNSQCFRKPSCRLSCCIPKCPSRSNCFCNKPSCRLSCCIPKCPSCSDCFCNGCTCFCYPRCLKLNLCSCCTKDCCCCYNCNICY